MSLVMESHTPINMNDNTKDLPIWARVVGYIGIPGSIAIYLVYTVTSSIAPAIENLTKVLLEHNIAAVGMIEDVRDSNNIIRNIMLADCLNNSENLVERNRCVGFESLNR